MLENGLETCTCKKKSCKRYGKCAECMAYHEANRRYAPYCKRKAKKEDTEEPK